MTETPVHVRATARVGAAPPPRAGVATLTPRRRPGHLGPVHVVQLMVVEATIVAVLVAFGQSPAVLILALLLGLALMAVALGRRQGRWWLERSVMRWQFRRRAKSAAPRPLADARLTAMRWLAPGLTVEDVDSPDGSQIGVAADDSGWYAVAALPASTAARSEARQPLPLDTLVSALAEADRSGSAVVQVVTHTVPAREDAGAFARGLPQSAGGPVDRITWIAVRLDARALAEMGVELPEQAPTIVAALMRHLVKTLRRSAITVRVLDREGVLDALDRSCDLVLPDSLGPSRPREAWDAWHSGRLAHRSFWLQVWPSLPQAGALLDRLVTAPAALSSVAVILAPRGDAVDIRCLTRVAAPDHQLASACAAVREGAKLAHAQLFELNGEQGPAVYATAPTGGGPR